MAQVSTRGPPPMQTIGPDVYRETLARCLAPHDKDAPPVWQKAATLNLTLTREALIGRSPASVSWQRSAPRVVESEIPSERETRNGQATLHADVSANRRELFGGEPGRKVLGILAIPSFLKSDIQAVICLLV